jgi:hypothetical protein
MYILGEHGGRSLVLPESRKTAVAMNEELVAALAVDAIELGSHTVHRPKKRREPPGPLPVLNTNPKV